MDPAWETPYYKCFLCGSLFASPASADECCKKAKAEVICGWLKENFGGTELEEYCNIVRCDLLAKGRTR